VISLTRSRFKKSPLIALRFPRRGLTPFGVWRHGVAPPPPGPKRMLSWAWVVLCSPSGLHSVWRATRATLFIHVPCQTGCLVLTIACTRLKAIVDLGGVLSYSAIDLPRNRPSCQSWSDYEGRISPRFGASIFKGVWALFLSLTRKGGANDGKEGKHFLPRMLLFVDVCNGFAIL
jgi:hypothetical protein